MPPAWAPPRRTVALSRAAVALGRVTAHREYNHRPLPAHGVIPFNTPTPAARARTGLRTRRAGTGESPAMPSPSPDAGPGRGRISRLDLVNFKSYGGKTTLGPFLDFSAVVGPNGAGAHRGSRGSRAGRSGEGAPAGTRAPAVPYAPTSARQASRTSWMRSASPWACNPRTCVAGS